MISYLNLNFESEQEKTRTGKRMLQWNETVKMLTTLLNHIFGFFFWIERRNALKNLILLFDMCHDATVFKHNKNQNKKSYFMTWSRRW